MRIITALIEKRRLLLGIAMGSLVLSGVPAAGQTHQWSQRFGDEAPQESWSVASDASGNVIITGGFSGQVGFGAGQLVSAGGRDIFVAKFNGDGAHLWSESYGDSIDDEGLSVAIDASGNVYVAGKFSVQVDFGGGPIASNSSEDIFLLKLDANGNHLWSKGLGGVSGNDAGRRVAVDDSDNVILIGDYESTINFGGGGLVSAGASDIFVVKYDASGTHDWSQRFGSTGAEVGNGVAIDGAGGVYITGSFQGTVNFGGGGLVSGGGSDIVVAMYGAAGAHVWSQRYGAVGDDVGIKLSADASGNVAVTGSFENTVNFGGGGLVSAGASDAFLVMYDSGGTHLWSRRFGDTSPDSGNDVAMDEYDNVFATGHFEGTADFGGGGLTAVDSADIYLAKYDLAGTHVSSQRFGDARSESGYGVAVDGAGDALITGHFDGVVNFGGGNLFSNGSTDIYVAKLDTQGIPPAVRSVADIGSDQGRSVLIKFHRSNLDFPTSLTPVVQYEAFRRVDPLPSSPQGAGAETTVDNRVIVRIISDASALADDWVYVGAVPAHGEKTYNLVAPTLADSTIQNGQHWSVFFIRAATASPFTYLDSAPDSGYSIDNLAPGVPQMLAYAAPGSLTWDAAPEPDFDYFTVYGSASATFDGSAVLIDHTIATAFDVQAAPFAYYHLTATDFAGNEGAAASTQSTPTGIPDMPNLGALSLSVHPNPFNPITHITYRVPVSGPVSVAVYDASGRLVDILVDNEYREPNEYQLNYHASGASGIYFVKVRANRQTETSKIVLLK